MSDDNAAAVFVDQPLREGHGERPALVTPAGTLTYARLRELTDRAGRGLRALGVEPEQRELPRTVTGKLQRFRLREQVGAPATQTAPHGQ